MTKLTVKDLFDKKGKVKLTELYVTNALEAYAAEKAGIDIQIVSFKKETLRTGVPTNRWFRDAHIKDIREAAPNTFMIYGLGQLSSPDKAIKIFSVVEVASLKTLAGINLGTLAVISSAFFVSVSDATKNSLTPVKFPLLNVKKTLEPEPTGLTFLSASNSVVTLIDIFPAVNVAPPVTIN